MSIGAGVVTVRRIQVLKPPTDVSLDWIVKRLKKGLVQPIALSEAKEHSVGWCHPFTGESDLENTKKLVYGDAFVFGMRTDTKRIPGTLFRLQLRAAFEEIAKKSGTDAKSGKPKLAKKMKDAARDRIKLELLKRSLPSVRLVEIVWHLQTNEIWFMSTSQSAIDEFEKLFNETFAVPFVHINPGTAGLNFDFVYKGKEPPLQKLMDLAPASLFRIAAFDEESAKRIEKEASL